MHTSDNAHYWYKLWLGMGTEFHRGQELLIGEIDRLRKKCGEWDGESHLDGKFQQHLNQMEKDWVKPESHPANKSIEDVAGGIDVPPKHPDTLIQSAT